MRVHAWADGFGVWHVRVSRTGAAPLIAARRAIRDELQARESPSAPVARYVWMSLVPVPEKDDAETIVYRESDVIGSGTTGVAAARTGREIIGIEREDIYAEVARLRVAHADLEGACA